MASADPSHPPAWRLIRRIAVAGVAIGLLGAVLLILGSEQLGVGLIVLGVVGVLLLSWLSLIVAVARDQRRYRPSRAMAIRNSCFGFVAGLWNEAGRHTLTATRIGYPKRMTVDELQAALRDPECPYLADGHDIVEALREGRHPQRSHVLSLTDLAAFLEGLGTSVSSLPELDRLMVDEVGAKRIDVVNLGEFHHRLLRRITRRRPPITNIHYDVPELPPA